MARDQEPRDSRDRHSEAARVEELELSEAASDLVQRLETERDDAVSARQRALADFANYQRRALDNETRARQQGAASVVRSVLPVLDHFDLALGQASDQTSAEQLAAGVRIVRDELIKALASNGVARIEPKLGEPFNPGQHEAIMQQAMDGVEPGHITSVLQPGYRVGDQVLRPAKVAVAPTTAADDANE